MPSGGAPKEQTVGAILQVSKEGWRRGRKNAADNAERERAYEETGLCTVWSIDLAANELLASRKLL